MEGVGIMEYRRFGQTYMIRLDIGDEVVECLKSVCRENSIALGIISGIGTAKQVTLGLLETATKVYRPKTFQGDMEILSLNGTVSEMKGESYLHIHITLGLSDHGCIGGHLDSAVVSAVAEIFIQAVEGKVDREYSDKAGVNLLRFL